MKISNNALNFLLAQYRAIFKRAYVKGIASAVLLTAALAAGQAQAAAQDATLTIEDFKNAAADSVSGTVTAATVVDLGKLTNDAQKSGSYTFLGDHILSGSDAKVTISGAENTHIIIDGSSKDLKIQNGASLTLTNTGKANTGIFGGNTTGNSGTLTVSGSGSTLTLNAASAWFNKLTIADNATINLKGKYYGASSATYGQWQYFSAMVGQNAVPSTSGSGTITASTLNLGDASFFGANKDVQISGSKITFDGTAVNPYKGQDASGADIYASAFINAGTGTPTEGTITIASNPVDNEVKSTLTVNPGKWGALYAKNINVSDTEVNIGSGATFIMDGDFIGTSNKDEGAHKQVILTLTDVEFTNKGTAIIGNPTSGGTATVSGTTTLTGNVKNYAQVTIDGSSNAAKLIISENQLTKPAAGATDPSGWFAGQSGSIILKSSSGFDNAVLQLVGTDANGLDLNKDITLTSGTSNSSIGQGDIAISGSGTLAGEHFVLTSSLKDKIGTTDKLA